MGYPRHFQQEFPPPTIAFTSDIRAGSDPLDNICRIVDHSESPPPALLIQTPPTPPPSPGCSQDSAGSDLSEETEINIKIATLHLLSMALNEYLQELQHSCLFELPVFFFETYYDEVMEKLRTPPIHVIIQQHLLCDLRSVPHIVCTIDEHIGYLLNTNRHTRGVKSALFRMIGNYWSGRHKI
ncbi:hypothetical protein ACER0C_010815 [Sarotherodon galilaeus]